jgi:PAS domain S-box-containing protein
MWEKTERQVESYKIWAMAVLFTGSCISLFYFHVILGIDTIVTHIFYVPIVLAAFWWKRKGLVVALFSSGLLIVSHVFLRPDMASHNDYFRAFMFMVTAFVVAELSRRIAKEHEALQTANQQLKASNQQLSANEQQLVSEVTERKKAEERIRGQHEFLRNTIESLGHQFYVIDANDNTVKMANVAAWQGKLPEKITCYMLSHKQNKPCSGADHPCPIEDIKKTKQPVTVEHIHYDKDGNPRNIEVHAHPIFDNEQNVTQIIEYCMDITERKLAEEELKKERDFSQNLINTAQTIVLVLDTDGRIVSFNPYMEELSGYRLEEVKGKDWFTTFLPECDYDEIRRIFKKAISDIQTRGNVSSIIRKDGEQRLIEWHDKTLKDDNGNIIGLLATGQDITERKRAELKIIEDREQLKSLASELSVTEERERRRIATELHDQIGQSLVFSKLKLDELHHSATSSELTKALDEICNNIGQIIQDTRTLTFDLSSPILNEIGLEAAVANWLDVQILEKHGIKTEFVDDGQQKPLDDDIKALLFRNVRELLVNIIKHAHANKVKVSIRRVDEHIHIDVEDDGKGFDSVKVISTAIEDTKFGLFSIRQRLEQLGGQFEIDSEDGRGSKITMTAPLK